MEYNTDEFVGKLYNDRFFCLCPIGAGTFSAVWLVYDVIENEFRAMKVYNPIYNDDAEYEIQHLINIDTIKLHDSFVQSGSVCIVMDLCGISLTDAISNYPNGVPYEEFVELSRKILKRIEQIHEKKFVHNDLKLDNITISVQKKEITEMMNWFKSLNPQEKIKEFYDILNNDLSEVDHNKRKFIRRKFKRQAIKSFEKLLSPIIINKVINNTYLNNMDDDMRLYSVDFDTGLPKDEIDLKTVNVEIIDFGNVVSFDEALDDDDEIQIRSCRPPEVFIGLGYNYKADMWTLGCTLFELITGHQLIQTTNEIHKSVAEDQSVLSQIYSYIGHIPIDLCLLSPKRHIFFDSDLRIKNFKKLKHYPLEQILLDYRPDLNTICLRRISELLRSLFIINVADRYTTTQCLKLPIFD